MFVIHMIQTSVIMVLIVLITLILCFITIIGSFFDKNGAFVHFMGKIWSKSVLFVSRIQVNMVGQEHIEPDRSYIIMANHLSNFDIPVLMASLNVRFRWLAKTELFKIPVFGLAMKKVGCIGIDRSNRKAAFKSLKRVGRSIHSGASVVIFPEGTRGRDYRIMPFKKGGFIVAIESKAEIVPIVIHGTWQIMPRTSFLIKPGKVDLRIEAPINSTSYSLKYKDDLLNHVHGVISESFEKNKIGNAA